MTEHTKPSRDNAPIKFLTASFGWLPGFPKKWRVLKDGCTRRGHCSLPLVPLPSSSLFLISFLENLPEFQELLKPTKPKESISGGHFSEADIPLLSSAGFRMTGILQGSAPTCGLSCYLDRASGWVIDSLGWCFIENVWRHSVEVGLKAHLTILAEAWAPRTLVSIR